MLSATTLQSMAEILAGAAAVVLFILLPYSIVALRIYEQDPVMVKARDAGPHPDQPVLKVTTMLTVINLVAMVYLVTTYTIRIIAQVEATGAAVPAQPAWSYAMSMGSYIIITVTLWAPAVILLRVKSRIVGKPFMRLPERWW